jgi:hypothetical protein
MPASRPGKGRSRHPGAFSRDAVHDHIYDAADERAGEWPVAVQQPVVGGAEQHVDVGIRRDLTPLDGRG